VPAPPAASHLILDIETVPDTDLYAPPDPPPGAERPFPPLWASRVITIGVLWLDQHLACRRLATLGDGQDEGAMLAELAALAVEWRPQLVTWNGRGFDLPLLALRALRHGIDFAWYYQEPETRSRYSPQGHLDLADFLADHGAARMTSLDGAARLIGLPGKNGMDGSQVEGLYREGKIQEVRDYCLSDVAQTAFVFLRYRLLTGQIDRGAYREAASALLTALEADPRLHRLTAAIDRPRLLL
jgi:predicted PolB exonuclease-like 3'-5' exonuclease